MNYLNPAHVSGPVPKLEQSVYDFGAGRGKGATPVLHGPPRTVLVLLGGHFMYKLS